MLSLGISKFKCATIAEAEMLALAGAKDILLAYQPVGPKGRRFVALAKRFPNASFSCLVDNLMTAQELAGITDSSQLNIFIDLNVGMNRTGISPVEAFSLWEAIEASPNLSFRGLHAYDGHIRDENFSVRKEKSDAAFEPVFVLAKRIEAATKSKTLVVAGGTPTFSVHVQRPEVECSPGTFIYWDKGYEQILKEQQYQHAALVISRVISKPAPGIVCIDLGHKSIASENPLLNRVTFLDGDDLIPVGHSEEHMILQTPNDEAYAIGDVLYGVPYHVCPTVALHEKCAVVENGKIGEYWTTLSRNKKITI